MASVRIRDDVGEKRVAHGWLNAIHRDQNHRRRQMAQRKRRALPGDLATRRGIALRRTVEMHDFDYHEVAQ